MTKDKIFENLLLKKVFQKRFNVNLENKFGVKELLALNKSTF